MTLHPLPPPLPERSLGSARNAPRDRLPLCVPLRLAPIPVTPTKPLTPSHLKALLWLDVLYKATRLVRTVHYDFSRTTFDITWQTLEFWDWLEQQPALSERVFSEMELGRLYVAFHMARAPRDLSRQVALRARVEAGWIHPASRQLLHFWQRHYASMGIFDPGLCQARALPRSSEQVFAQLETHGLLLDVRPLGGAAFLDLTQHGVPLRTLLDVDGRDNHLMCSLRELMPCVEAGEAIALLCDKEMREDYLLLEHCLRQLGARVLSLSIGRVSLPGTGTASARHGGWEEHTVERLRERFETRFSQAGFRLGLRLYFIATLGAGDKVPLDYRQLERCLQRAEGLLEQPASHSREAALARLEQLVEHRGFVDPYRVVSLLLTSHERAALMPIVHEVFA